MIAEERREVPIEASIWPIAVVVSTTTSTELPSGGSITTNQPDPVTLLEQIYDHTERVLAEIGPDQYELPTPCTEWNVRELVNHVIGSVHFMASAVAGDAPPAGDPPDSTGPKQPASEFRAAADRPLAVWRADGALDGTVHLGPVELPASAALGLNQLDVLTHSWDVAEATGVDRSMDPPVAESVLTASQMIISDECAATGSHPRYRSLMIAPAHDRLAAFLGRQPA